ANRPSLTPHPRRNKKPRLMLGPLIAAHLELCRGAMQLQSLLGPETTAPCGHGGVDIPGITADSRQVRPGWLFAAIAGNKADGARFIPEAIAKGAAAVLI